MRAVLAGGSGLVGNCLLKELLLPGSPFERVVSLARRPGGTSEPRLEERIVDFGNLPDLPPLSLPTVVFCALGTTIRKAGSQAAFHQVDFDYVVELARWGRAQGASHFLVVSSMGADPQSSIFYSRTKGEMEEAIKRLGYPALDIFRPSLLTGGRAEWRLGERLGEAALFAAAPLLQGRLRHYRAIPAKLVALAMTRAATRLGPGIRLHLSDDIRRLATTPES